MTYMITMPFTDRWPMQQYRVRPVPLPGRPVYQETMVQMLQAAHNYPKGYRENAVNYHWRMLAFEIWGDPVV
jgi:hypothetical protein